MASKGVLRIKILGDDDGLRRALRSAADGVSHFGKDLAKSAKGAIISVGKLAVTGGALASTAGTLAPYLAKAAAEIGHVITGALQASPALLGMAAAGAFALVTIKQFGPALAKSFEPLTDSFKAAGTAAGELAAKGVRPLAAEFARVNMPNIAGAMNRIGEATNGVIKRFLQWANSTAGVQAIRNVVDSTAGAFERLGPHASRFAESLGNMLGRIAGVSTAAGASGLAGALDWLSQKMDQVNAASVQGGFDKLAATYRTVRDAISQTVAWIQQATQFWREHRTEIMLVQDALSILAIAFGGPVIAAAAAVGLIIRHWDQLKAAWQSVTAFFQQGTGAGFMDNLRSAAETVMPALVGAFNTIKAAVVPVLAEIWNKIKGQLIPAFGEFIAAISPVVSFLVGVLGPVVASVFGAILNIISGAISIITGILQVFTGILTGNWSKAWEGVKNILSGAWQAIVGLFNLWIFGRIGGILGRLGGWLGGLFARGGRAMRDALQAEFGVLISFVRGIPGRILGALGNLASLLFNAGKNVVQGLINGIKSMIGAVGRAIGSVASKIRNALPFSPAREGPLRSHPPELAGRRIVELLASGLMARQAHLKAVMAKISGLMAGSLSGAGQAAREILGHLNRGGSVFEDLSFRGNSALVGQHNDDLARAFAASGSRDLRTFLTDFITDSEANARRQLATLTAQAPAITTAAAAGATAGGVVRVVFDVQGADEDLKRLFRRAVRNEAAGSAEKFFRAAQ